LLKINPLKDLWSNDFYFPNEEVHVNGRDFPLFLTVRLLQILSAYAEEGSRGIAPRTDSLPE